MSKGDSDNVMLDEYGFELYEEPRHVVAAIDYVLYSQGDAPIGTAFDIP